MICVIGNPAAGRGQGARRMAEVEAALRRRGLAHCILGSTGPTMAARLAREGAVGASLALVVGGDGTVRDVVEGLTSIPQPPPLGVVPAGTGNDLARSLGLPRHPAAALEAALGARERPVDVWRWNTAPFLNVAGIGLDAAVARIVNARFRHLRGPLPYVAGLLAVLPRFQPFALRVEGPEGEWAGRAWLAAFGNGAYYGGGMRIAPGAALDDGLLQMVIVGAVSKLELLAQFPRIFRGSHVRHPHVTVHALSQAQVEAPCGGPTLDGELLETVPATVRPHARLRVRVATQAGEGPSQPLMPVHF